MKYEVGDYIKHPHFGIGKIEEVDPQSGDNRVRFLNARIEVFSEQLLRTTGGRLPADGFQAMAFNNPDAAKTLVEENPVQAVILLLRDFRFHQAKTEEIRTILETYTENWEEWWKRTQTMLKESTRIDSSQSRKRVYRLSMRDVNNAQSFYESFVAEQQYQQNPDILIEAAIRALDFYSRGDDLKETAVDVLRKYILAYPDLADHNLELAARGLERLVEWGYTSAESLDDFLLSHLNNRNLSLQRISDSTGLRLVSYLTQQDRNRLGDIVNKYLSGAVLANNRVYLKVKEWAELNNRQSILIGMILQGLGSIPSEIRETTRDWNQLSRRISRIIELLPMVAQVQSAATLFLAEFRPASLSLQNLPEASSLASGFDEFFNGFLNFAALLDNILQTSDDDVVVVILDESNWKTWMLIRALHWDIRSKGDHASEFIRKYERFFWANFAKTRDAIFSESAMLLERDPLKLANLLVEVAQKYPDPILVDKAGRKICEIARDHDELLPLMLRQLDFFDQRQTVYDWSNTLNSLREAAYFKYFLDPGFNIKEKDPALSSAVNKFTQMSLSNLHNEFEASEAEVTKLNIEKERLEKLVFEKDQVIRELISLSSTGDAHEVFDAKIKLIKKLTGSIGEFGRFTSSQPAEGRLIQAILKRLENILAAEGVETIGTLGELTGFDPIVHQFSGNASPAPGEKGTIIEKGYRIKDPHGKWLLLKPAIITNSSE